MFFTKLCIQNGSHNQKFLQTHVRLQADPGNSNKPIIKIPGIKMSWELALTINFDTEKTTGLNIGFILSVHAHI